MDLKRIEYIDIAKGIGIILVVIGHTINGFSLPGMWIWSFHMPLFFIISGLCFDATRNRLFLPFVIKKLRTLLFPLLVFSILMVLLKSLIFPETFKLSILKHNFPDVAYWFVLILFLSEILFFCINKIGNRHYCMALLFISLFMGQILYINNISFSYSLGSVFVCTFFYGFANIFRRTIFLFLNKVETNYKNIIASAILLFIPMVSVYFVNNTIDLRLNRIPEPIAYHILIAFVGGGSILLLSKLLSKVDFIKDVMIYIGKNSLIILLLHMFYISLSTEFISPLISSRMLYKIIELCFTGILLFLSINVINNRMKWVIGKF